MEYTLLDSDEKIEKQISKWADVEELAVDFECEFNLHVYGEHLCLIQIFDKSSFYIIDAVNDKVTEKGLSLFFSLKARKVWFDCQSDQALVYKKYGLKIENIYDIRVLAKALGFQGNLLSLEKEYLGIDIKINKKKNQQANWMKRPLDNESLEYALLDVAYLIDLEKVLLKEVMSKNLVKNVERSMKRATDVKEPEPGWTRIGPWRRYNEKQRRLVKDIYIARDKIAKRFNVPASRVLDKQTMTDLVLNPPSSYEKIKVRLSGQNPRFISFLVPSIAQVMAEHKLS